MINIKDYISKDLVFGAVGGVVLGTVITSIIDTKVVNKAEEELEISKGLFKQLVKNVKLMNDLAQKAMNDQDEVVKAQGLKIQELEDELEKYDNEDFYNYLQEKVKEDDRKREEEKVKKDDRKREEETVKKAIEKKDWTTVYNKAEGWYNHNPVQMGRYEVFRYLNKDGYVTDEEVNEARNYYGSLWDYVGD